MKKLLEYKWYLAALALVLCAVALVVALRGAALPLWAGLAVGGLVIAAGYIMGAVPYGLLIAKTFCGIDPRGGGSGNIGATNVARLCGVKYGVAALACDVLKGAFSVLLALYAPAIICEGTPLNPVWLASLAGFAALLGHRYSPYIGFKGGKAVASTIGVFLPLAFVQLLIAAALCVLVIWRSGFVSLGSLVLVSAMPVILAIFGRWELLPLALAVAALVIWAHRANIQRLLRKEEKSWLKSKHKSE